MKSGASVNSIGSFSFTSWLKWFTKCCFSLCGSHPILRVVSLKVELSAFMLLKSSSICLLLAYLLISSASILSFPFRSQFTLFFMFFVIFLYCWDPICRLARSSISWFSSASFFHSCRSLFFFRFWWKYFLCYRVYNVNDPLRYFCGMYLLINVISQPIIDFFYIAILYLWVV